MLAEQGVKAGASEGGTNKEGSPVKGGQGEGQGQGVGVGVGVGEGGVLERVGGV